MRRRMLACALAAPALATVAAGCGERAEPFGPLAEDYPVTVRGADDRPAVIRATPRRIVALDRGSAELVAALGGADRLVGVPTGMPDLARDASVVVRPSGQVDVDAVARLEPDLIVATPATDQVDLSRAEREADATVYVQPAESVADIVRAALEVGFILDEPIAARALATRLRRAITQVEQRVGRERPVSVFVDTGFLITVPERSLLGDLVKRAGGRSVAGATPGPEPIDPGALADLDPDVYLATTESGVTLAKLLRDPGTRDLTAVREERVAILSSELVTRPGPRIADALAAVARALHPDAFR